MKNKPNDNGLQKPQILPAMTDSMSSNDQNKPEFDHKNGIELFESVFGNLESFDSSNSDISNQTMSPDEDQANSNLPQLSLLEKWLFDDVSISQAKDFVLDEENNFF